MTGRQVAAGLKKEVLFFTRGFKFAGMIIAFVVCAMAYPVLMKMTSEMMAVMSEQMGETGTPAVSVADISYNANMFDIGDMMNEMMEPETLSILSYFTAISSISGPSLILTLALLMGTAGQEQKKRSIIMPRTAGLSPAGYVLPKFMIYPLLVFAVSALTGLLSNGVCVLFFGSCADFKTSFVIALLVGVYNLFTVCMYLFAGISTESPGLSIVLVIAANGVFSTILGSVFSADKYTPWSLTEIASNMTVTDSEGMSEILGSFAPESTSAGDLVLTVCVTLVLSVVFMLLTLFVVTAKKTDNTADEVY